MPLCVTWLVAMRHATQYHMSHTWMWRFRYCAACLIETSHVTRSDMTRLICHTNECDVSYVVWHASFICVTYEASHVTLSLCVTWLVSTRHATQYLKYVIFICVTVATSRKKTCFDAGKIGFCHCAAVLQTQVPKLCTDLDLSLLYILILGTYSKFARKNNFLALGVCFPQPCSSAGRRFAASRSRLQTYRRNFICTTKNSMECVVKWIPLRISVRSRNTQYHLNLTFFFHSKKMLSSKKRTLHFF